MKHDVMFLITLTATWDDDESTMTVTFDADESLIGEYTGDEWTLSEFDDTTDEAIAAERWFQSVGLPAMRDAINEQTKTTWPPEEQ